MHPEQPNQIHSQNNKHTFNALAYKLLKAANEIATVLLTNEDLDRGVKSALEILGNNIEADRLTILQHYDDRRQDKIGGVICQYEWIHTGIKSQILHPQLYRITYEGIEKIYDLFLAGKHWGGLIKNLSEPFRSGQLELQVKATYGIPIAIEGQYWGAIGLDFCRTARQLQESEIAILKTAATCIGSAIARQQIIREREEASRAAILEKQRTSILNERDYILRITTQVAQVLLNDECVDRAISSALKIIGVGINSDRVVVMEHHEDATGASMGYVEMLYEWHSAEAVAQLQHPGLHRVSYEGIKDWYRQLIRGEAVGGIVEELAEPMRSGQRELGVKSTYAIPIMVNDKYWGVVSFDDCKEAIQRSNTKISLLKTTAVCIASAIKRERIHQEQEQIERKILLERQQAAQLAEHNLVLQQRDRLLAATAAAANTISTAEDFDLAINRALQIIGEAIDTDRVVIIEIWQNSSKQSIPHWRVLYEWHSLGTVSQIDHPEAQQGSWQGIEKWYELLNSGQNVSYRREELPEPFRSEQAKIGVKVTYTVPIFVEGKFWGVAAFDDCREVTRRTEAEISILQTAAACIGGAIEKERARQAHERTTQERVEQLAEHNRVLEKRDRLLAATAAAANIVSTAKNFDLAINRALQIIGEAIDTDRVAVLEQHDDPSGETTGYVKMLYEWHSIHTIAQLEHPLADEVSWSGIEDWYELLCHGQWMGGIVEELPEPFRSTQKIVGAKSTYAIPIVVEGKYWGIVILDSCDEANLLNEAEINVLKAAATSIGEAIEKKRSQKAYQQAIEAKAEQLEQSNQVLTLREQWLEATANAANKLLLIDELDEGINAALKVLGESLDCDRITILQHIEDPAKKPSEFVKVLYEWNSPDVTSQITHPELNHSSIAGIEEWFAKLKAGEWIGGVIKEQKQPFRLTQIKLGVKATYSVPIFTNNIYWGAIGIDFCRYPKRLNEPEIAVFKTAASCLGSAIYRQQIQQEKEQAELAILDERNRMAREIHDTLAQAFTGIALQLEAAKSSLGNSPSEVQKRLNLAKKLAKEGIAEARRSVRALRPEALEVGLAIAIEQLIEKMISGTNIKAQAIIEGKIRPLTPETEVALFRITQEALTNSLRHAAASVITIRLIYTAELIQLQITDNGIGFEPNITLGQGFGLIGIEERCDRFKGSLMINSAIGLGTEIKVTLSE